MSHLSRIVRALFVAVVAVAGVALAPLSSASPVSAVSISAPSPSITSSVLQSIWDPGYIISDEQFYDGYAMSAAQIQTFLNGKVPVCDYARAQMPCLKDYTSATPNVAANIRCQAYSGSANERASDIIARVAQVCGISPKTLLVLLQKEQSLVTDTWPYQSQYRAATGYGCPDTAPCDDGYVGFFSQVYGAAYAFRAYRANGGGPNYKAFQTNQIRWSPNAACGSTPVYIRNYATAGLYNYTPYQPNAAALANPYGIGDSCSAYGNRNFFVLWYDWFGSPTEKTGPDYFAEYHAANGGNSGWLGSAVGSAELLQGLGQVGYRQTYQNGTLYWTRTNGLAALSGAVLTKYNAIGGPTSWLGWPYGATTDFTANGVSGKYQYFQGATMYWTADWGARVIQPSTIRPAFIEFGATAGRPGWPIGDEVRVGSAGSMQAFQHGTLLARSSGARFAVWGAVEDYYLAQGGPTGWLGWPTGNEVPWTAGGVTGLYQNFEYGIVYSSASTSTVSIATGPVRVAFGAAGGTSGPLGWPVGEADCAGGRECVQEFQGGAVYSSPRGGAFGVHGPIYDYYLTQGAQTGSLGWPVEASRCPAGGDCSQAFEGGIVTVLASGGTVLVPHGVAGVIADLYNTMGGSSGALGIPKSTVLPLSANGAGLWQRFEGGAIYARNGSPAFAVMGDALTYYIDAGGPGGSLGWPTGAPTAWSANSTSGIYQYFQFATLYDSAATPVASVSGTLRNAYGAAGGSTGSLGWPVSDTRSAAGGSWQDFQGGAIYLSAAGTRVLPLVYADYLTSKGGPSGALGWPASAPIAWTANGVTGTYVNFQKGIVYNSGTTGTVGILSAAIRSAYGAAGGSSGVLGWPTSDASCDSDGRCEQVFQGGRIYQVASSAYVITGAVLTKFLAQGGTGGPLGWPWSSAVAWTAGGVSGTYTYFDHGIVYDSSALGTTILAGRIRTAFSAAGGTLGPLGWPTADAVCDPSSRCEQAFQGGLIHEVSGSAFAMTGSVLTTFTNAGGTGGELGWPIGPDISWTANGVSGVYRDFERGIVYSAAPTGSVIVKTGSIRSAYGALGGSSGSLGWPIGNAACDGSGNCTQAFQGGEIRTFANGSTSYAVGGPMLDAYLARGGTGGALGLPSNDPVAATATTGTSGTWQYFAGTATIMYWTRQHGAHTISNGPIRTHFGSLGGLAGSTLGYPIADETCASGVCTQAFERGTIVSDGQGAWVQP